MSEISKKIDKVIKLGLTDLLKSNGFNKKGRRWHKKTGDDWLLVGLQASSYNKGTEGKFAINLGIYNSAVEQLAERFYYKEGETPKAEGSTLECRLNELDEDLNHWWELNSATNLQLVSDEVVEKMEKYGLPWLFDSNNLNYIEEVTRHQHSRGSFAASILIGDEDGAIARIKKAIEDRPFGKESTLAWAKKMGLKVE